jgi:RimJ/RimL family protein N-acetyltransferase
MHIRPLLARDATRYRELMLQAYELAADAFTSTADERAQEPTSFWVKRIEDPTGLSAAFGAFDGDALVGTVALEFAAKPKTRHKALVIGMYVVPQARGTGAARGLLAEALAFAQQRPGIRLVTLTVTEGNEPAIRLYRQAGFQAWGVEPEAILTPGGFKGKVHMALLLQQAP